MLSNFPGNDTNWFTKGLALCCHIYVIMHVKDPQLSFAGEGHRVPLAGFSFHIGGDVFQLTETWATLTLKKD